MVLPWLKKYIWNHRLMSEGVPLSITEKSNAALETQAPKKGRLLEILEKSHFLKEIH